MLVHALFVPDNYNKLGAAVTRARVDPQVSVGMSLPAIAQLLRITSASKTHPTNVGNCCSDGIFLGQLY